MVCSQYSNLKEVENYKITTGQDIDYYTDENGICVHLGKPVPTDSQSQNISNIAFGDEHSGHVLKDGNTYYKEKFLSNKENFLSKINPFKRGGKSRRRKSKRSKKSRKHRRSSKR